MTRIIDRPEYKDWNIYKLWDELASMQSMLDRERIERESLEVMVKVRDETIAVHEKDVLELESTLAEAYEQMEFYEWYWTLNRDNHNREELNTDYHQVSGSDIPEEAW